MFNYADYDKAVNATSVSNGQTTQKNHNDYQVYESLWDNYFNQIFIPNSNFKEDSRLRLILLESCPKGNCPHPNYIFNKNMYNNKLAPKVKDTYLHQITKGFVATNGTQPFPPTKMDALVYLANQNVLLMDIFFSHGFDLSKKKNTRNLINQNLTLVCDFDKIKTTINALPIAKQSVNILFATPPKICIQGIHKIINFGTCFGTMTAGSGYPSYKILENHIKKGF
jgi:hypothetical protein